MMRYNYTYCDTSYDFEFPEEIYIVDTSDMWHFIKGQNLKLNIETRNAEKVIVFQYIVNLTNKTSTTWFYPNELLDSNVISYISTEKFNKLKAFI